MKAAIAAAAARTPSRRLDRRREEGFRGLPFTDLMLLPSGRGSCTVSPIAIAPDKDRDGLAQVLGNLAAGVHPLLFGGRARETAVRDR